MGRTVGGQDSRERYRAVQVGRCGEQSKRCMFPSASDRKPRASAVRQGGSSTHVHGLPRITQARRREARCTRRSESELEAPNE